MAFLTKTTTWPITLRWPANSPVGVISGQWRRLDSGEVEAVYRSYEELLWCIAWLSNEPTLFLCTDEDIHGPATQGRLFPVKDRYYQEGG
jgi:hypothetical protein